MANLYRSSIAMTPLYPSVTVELTGQDGNAFSIIGRICGALRQGGVSAEERTRFSKEASSGDYDHVLRTAMRWVNWS